MSLIGTFVGALVALVARPERPVQIPVNGEVERLKRSQARLVDLIERLERELLTEQRLCTHWKAEAMRLASAQREQINGRNAFAHAQAQQAQSGQYSALGQYSEALQGFHQGFCNCVPSRAQVWAADQGDE